MTNYFQKWKVLNAHKAIVKMNASWFYCQPYSVCSCKYKQHLTVDHFSFSYSITIAIAQATLSIDSYPIKEHNVHCVRVLTRDREGFKKS